MRPLAPSMLLLLIWLGSLHIITADNCESPWMWMDDHCYLFSSFTGDKLSWNEARHYCQTFSYLADLAVIREGLKEYNTIVNFMHTYNVDSLWMGACDEGHEMSWLWVDNRPVDLFMPLWHCTAPAYDTSANCAVLASGLWGDVNGRVTMGDTYCDEPMYFVCERNVHREGYNPAEEEELMNLEKETQKEEGSLLGDLQEDDFAAFQEMDYVI